MDTKRYSRLIMLGAARETRGSIAAVVDVYRAHGLFQRWPTEYLETHGEGSLAAQAGLVAKALRRFAETLVRERRVAVHLHAQAGAGFWRDALFAGAALAARCPLIVQLHGSGFETFYDAAGPVGRAVIRFLFERAACVLAPAESLRGWLRGITHNRAQVVCMPNPVACDPLPQPARADLVLFLGRMEPAKGIFDLLDAVAAIRPAVPEVRLVCAGDGDRVAVARYAERLGIADAVKFTGWVGPSGKRALLESAAVFAAPSYDASLPISLLEAMGAGVPVVAAAVGGIPEVVVDGVTGYLVAPGDRATLARLLRDLLHDHALGQRIGAAGRESVRLRFAPERALPKLEGIYAAVGLDSVMPEPAAPVREADLRRAA